MTLTPGPATTVTEPTTGTTQLAFTVAPVCTGGEALSGASLTLNTLLVNGAAPTATAGADYDGTASKATVTVTCSLLFPVSDGFTVTVKGDSLDEDAEHFVVQLRDGATTAASTTVTVNDAADDLPPTVRVDDAAAAEGTGGATTQLGLPLTLSAPSGRDITVGYAIAPGSATAGQDYVAPGATPTVTILKGQTTGSIPVTVNQDGVDEPDETLTATLGALTNATVGAKTSAVGTILNDDQPVFDIGSVAAAEGDTGTTTFTFPVTLSNPSARTLTVGYHTADVVDARVPADKRATAGQDYTPVGDSTLTFAPGETSKSFTVSVTPDTTFENNEAFQAEIFSPSVGTLADPLGLGPGIALGAILNDDQAPGTGNGGGSTGNGGGTGSTGTGTGGTGSGSGTTPGGSTGVFGTATPGGDTTEPVVTLGALKFKKPKRMTLSISCPATERTCRTTLSVFTVPSKRSKVKQLRRELKLGSRVVLIPGGKTASITINLSPSNQKLVRRGRQVSVKAYAVVRDDAGNVSTANRAGTLRG